MKKKTINYNIFFLGEATITFCSTCKRLSAMGDLPPK